jgi:hypothetical protein
MSLFDKLMKALKPHVDAGVLDSALSVVLAEVATIAHDEIVKGVNKATAPKAKPPVKAPAAGNGNSDKK